MKQVLLVLSLSLSSCQVYNSATKDKLLYGANISDVNFANAFNVMAQKCFSCHIEFSAWTSQQDWVNNGYVTAGNLSASKVYYRLFGANLNVGTENMPIGAALTAQEIGYINTWITNM